MAKVIQTRRIRGLSKAYLNPEIAYQIGTHLKTVFNVDSVVFGTTKKGGNHQALLELIRGAKETGLQVQVIENIAPVMFSYYTETKHNFGIILFEDKEASRLKFYKEGLELFDDSLKHLTQSLTNPTELSSTQHDVQRISYDELLSNYLNQYKSMVLEPINLSIAYTLPQEINHEYIRDILNNICDEAYEAKDEASLKDTVIEKKCDIGFNFDTFSERLTVFDHIGEEHHGDHVLYLVTKLYKDNNLLHKNTAVISNMINPGVLKAFKDLGIKPERVNHSEMHILDVMNKSNYTLAATREGLMVLNPLRNSSDALLSAIAIMHLLQQTKQTVKSLLEDVALYPEVMLTFEGVAPNIIETKLLKQKIKELQKRTAFEGVFSVYYEIDTETLHAYISHINEEILSEYQLEFERTIKELKDLSK